MMEGSFLSKRPFDPSSTPTTTTDRRENGNKRRQQHHHHHHHHPSTPNSSSSSSSSMNFKPPPPPLKLSAGETLFRILCPAIKTGGVIGKGGAIIRQFREETGAKIRIDEAFPGCDERVIFIVAETLRGRRSGDGGENDEEDFGEEEEVSSPAQHALLRVFERILKVDEERLRVSGENEDGLEEKEHKIDNSSISNSVMGGAAAATMNQGSVVCRLLAPSHQVGCVLGRGGKIVEKIRQASGAQIRILPKEHIPPCAFAGDELIQITGNHSAVKKALLSVSSCLQDNSRPEATNSAAPKPLGSSLRGSGMPVQVDQFLSRGHSTGNHALDYHSRNYSSIPGSESIGASHRKVPEEEVVFRLLCHLDKVGSLIGKGGAIIRALQSDTCASIKIADAAPDSDERVVLISAREDKVVEIYVTCSMDHACCGVLNAKMSLEQSHSPAQDAVIRVQSRIAEIGFEPGAAVVARLLVPSQQIGCLLGKGGNVITEMRRATGASIRIFAKEQVPKCGAQNDEVVQVIGSLQSVQDALFHITGRLRESLFPMKPPFNGIGPPGPPPYMCGPPESPIPLFRPRYDPASPGHYPSSNGFSNEHTGPPHPMDRQSVHLHGMDHVNRGTYPYGSERSGHGPIFDPHSSPRSWTPQSGSNGNLRCGAEVGTGLASRNGLIGSGSQMAVTTSVEVVVPLEFWGSICGEDNNLSHVRQISGANVVVHDLRPGSTEGVVFVSGTSDQIDAAQSLIQAFILSGQATP